MEDGTAEYFGVAQAGERSTPLPERSIRPLVPSLEARSIVKNGGWFGPICHRPNVLATIAVWGGTPKVSVKCEFDSKRRGARSAM